MADLGELPPSFNIDEVPHDTTDGEAAIGRILASEPGSTFFRMQTDWPEHAYDVSLREHVGEGIQLSDNEVADRQDYYQFLSRMTGGGDSAAQADGAPERAVQRLIVHGSDAFEQPMDPFQQGTLDLAREHIAKGEDVRFIDYDTVAMATGHLITTREADVTALWNFASVSAPDEAGSSHLSEVYLSRQTEDLVPGDPDMHSHYSTDIFPPAGLSAEQGIPPQLRGFIDAVHGLYEQAVTIDEIQPQ